MINELYLRLAGANVPEWRNRTHFLAVAANTLRRILIDYARANRAERRGGKETKVSLELVDVGGACSYEDLVIIDEALTQLETAEPRAARVAELRFFTGLDASEIAEEFRSGGVNRKPRLEVRPRLARPAAKLGVSRWSAADSF